MYSLGKELEDCYELACNPAIRANSTQTDTAYPRPQLRRNRWICLNGSWKFRFDEAGRFAQPSDISDWTHRIEVLFAPESAKSGTSSWGFTPTAGTSGNLIYPRVKVGCCSTLGL